VPYRAFRRNLTASYFAPFIIAMAMLAAIILWRFQSQVSITNWIEHSDQVTLHVKDMEIKLREMQLAYRGYLLSRDSRYLAELGDTQRIFGENLAKIAALVADNADQEQRLLKINDAKETWIKAMNSLIGQSDAGQLSMEGFGQVRNQAEGVFNSLEDFIVAEQRIRERRASSQATEYQALFVLVPVLSVVVMFFLGYWGWREIQNATKDFQRAFDVAEKARADAEKASRAKDNFLGTVSHELRNPLNSIMLWSTALLRDQALNEKSRRGVAAIERAVKAQAQLIEDLLDISRIENGRMRLDVQTVDLAEVVRAGIESMRAAAEAKSITLQEIVDPRVDAVAGDPGRLQQVIWNLVSNAVKFTPKGGRIEVRVERINSHLEVIVADTGQGIEPNAIGSVFERFWQDEGSGQSRSGVGLGLSIVKEIVGLHGGTVSAHSDGPGEGSTFTVRLPLPVSTIASSDPRRHPTVARLANASKAPRLDGFSILVVDDDPDACEALKHLLGSLGANVNAATSARGALELLDTFHPDAVVSDIGMPVEDGYFLARELRKREREGAMQGHLPVIALTAYGRVEDKVQILMAGFDSHTVKPVDPVELSTVLGTLITSPRTARIG
jgi:signal transduction histidine kinase/ActR/RegA family two-component response regulator